MNKFLYDYVEELKKLRIPEQDIPNAKEKFRCQRNSENQAACMEAKDDKNRRCGWCSGLNVHHYPYNPRTDSLCMHQHFIEAGVCKMLKGNLKPCKASGFTLQRVDVSFILSLLCIFMLFL